MCPLGNRRLRCRWAICWQVVLRSEFGTIYPCLVPGGSTPAIEDIRLACIEAATESDPMVVVDEPSAFLHSKFDYAAEDLGSNMPLDSECPWPVMLVPQPFGQPLKLLVVGNVNGVRSGPASYEVQRDENMVRAAGLMRSRLTESLN